MNDVASIALIVLVFAGLVGFVRMCERIVRTDDHAEPASTEPVTEEVAP